MSRTARLSSLGLAITIVAVSCATANGAVGFGVVRGVVRDQTGTPLVGATVAIFEAASKADKPVRNTATDDKGHFEAQVAPGRYVLRAVAAGFNASEFRARVAANRETVLDTIALRRANTLADRRRATDQNPYRQVVRSARGTVFHVDEDKPEQQPEEADAMALALTERENAVHGVVQAVAASGPSSYTATNFAVARRVKDTDVTLVGQMGLGSDAPMRLEATTATDIGDDHRASVTLGFGRLRAGGPGALDELDQYTVEAVDRWQVLDRFVVLYGVNYTRFGGASDASAVLPRFGIEFAPDNRTQIFARLTPASATDEIASFDLETGEVTFVEPAIAPVAADRLAEATPDRSRRFEVGFGRLIDEQSNVEVMAFWDVASGRGIGFLSVPAAGADAEFRTGSLDGRASGVRVLYTRRFTDTLTGTFGYATGRGLELNQAGFADPVHLFNPASFHVVATQLQADFDTGTRVTAVYRFGPSRVVFAVDPFAGRLAAHQPAASIFIAQSLPMPDFFPGEWEAMVDVRNLFDAAPAREDRELMLVEYSRLVRAGLSFRF